ncbi:MAG: 2-C-methyl-D-erythritol 4-phosphate cytidylyltransferase [Candidatus Izimaplasma sp.]|nr:2-C-methyl-D-erythritol 4-phosphate cytidylyltransferase [Candidatus Izimaplasma bacterium]
MFSAIILGGGKGKRLGLGYNKVIYNIKGKTILEHAANNFINDDDFKEVVIVIDESNFQVVQSLFKNNKVKIIHGGETRQSSVYNGLKKVTGKYVVIHDGARPNVSIEEINKVKKSVINGSCTLYTKVKEATIETKDNKLVKYLNREDLGLIKTPQGFNTKEIITAYNQAIKEKKEYFDDASLVYNQLKKDIILIEGNDYNIKITSKSDLSLMEELL